VRHGDRLEILARRRRFVKARSSAGAVGWTDGALLFSLEQMEALRAMGRWAATLPPQGEATVFDTLNVHTGASREDPSFHQIREGEHVTVVAHRLVASPSRTEDWSLVRIKESQAGWVLTRNLVMAIPDAVAQYAEGHRIMSYLPLGEVRDGDQVKQNWLWATIQGGQQPFEFDSVRVFVWSKRRHRYETAYIERNLKGRYPVEVQQHADAAPTFSIVAEEKDGSLSRRTYGFQGFRVRLTSKSPWTPPPVPRFTAAPPDASKTGARKAESSFFQRVGGGLTGLRRKIFGR
jgi:hypothetical protein